MGKGNGNGGRGEKNSRDNNKIGSDFDAKASQEKVRNILNNTEKADPWMAELTGDDPKDTFDVRSFFKNTDEEDAYALDAYSTIVKERSNGTTKKEWDAYIQKQPKQTIDTDSLHATQATVNGANIISAAGYAPNSSKSAPVVLQVDGKNYLIDGHHRTIANKLRGVKTMKAIVIKCTQSEYERALS